MCRVESISFDLEKRQGATFILCDSLQSGVLSIIGIGRDKKEALKILGESLNFIQRQAGTPERKALTMYDAPRDEICVADVLSKVILINKHMNKQ